MRERDALPCVQVRQVIDSVSVHVGNVIVGWGIVSGVPLGVGACATGPVWQVVNIIDQTPDSPPAVTDLVRRQIS